MCEYRIIEREKNKKAAAATIQQESEKNSAKLVRFDNYVTRVNESIPNAGKDGE